MRKIAAIVVCLLVIVNMLSVNAFAVSADTATAPDAQSQNIPVTLRSPRSTVILSDGDVSVTFDALASKEVRSADNYKTNTQKIKVSLKSSKSITVKVSIYRTDGTYVVGTTKDLGTVFKTSWTFTNLNQGNAYYITVTNLGQRDVTVSGTVSE